MHERFGYCFATPPGSEYPPIVTEHPIEIGLPVTVDGLGGPVTGLPFDMIHGSGHALGFRFGDLAYASDVSAMPQESLPALDGLEVLVIDALRYTPHPTHFSLSEALAFIERVRPKQAVVTNLHTDLDYDRLSRELPGGVAAAFDGMRIELAGSSGRTLL